MSLKILSQPASLLLSAGNNNYYTLSGTTYGGPNVFEYRYTADVYVGGVYKVTLKSFPDPATGFGVFNTISVVDDFLSFDFIAPTSGTSAVVQNAPNTGSQVYLQFGEEYISGSTFTQTKNIVSGNTAVYVNMSLPFTTSINLDTTIYYAVDDSGPFNQYLTGINRVSDMGEFIPGFIINLYTTEQVTPYFLSNSRFSPDQFQNIVLTITCQNANGATIGAYTYTSPIQVSGATDVMALALSFSNFAKLNASNCVLDSGSFPIVTAAVDHIFIDLSTYSAGGATQQMEGIRLNLQTDCGRWASSAYNITWLNEYGGFDSWYFNKKNQITSQKNTQVYKKQQGSLQSNGSFNINTYSRNTGIYFTEILDSIEMNTDFLQDTDVLFLKGLASSPVVYMTDQSGTVTNIVVENNSFVINRRVNQKIYSFKMTVRPSYNDYRQLL